LHNSTPSGSRPDEPLGARAQQLDEPQPGQRLDEVRGQGGAPAPWHPDLREGGLTGRRPVLGVDPVGADARGHRLDRAGDGPRRHQDVQEFVGLEGHARHGCRL
jgi:hypothetical protein